MSDKKLINYKEAINLLDDIPVEKFHEAMKKGELTVSAKHPVTGKILPYRIYEFMEDGTVRGEFIQ